MYWVLDFERVEYSFFNLLVPLLVKILIVFTHEDTLIQSMKNTLIFLHNLFLILSKTPLLLDGIPNIHYNFLLLCCTLTCFPFKKKKAPPSYAGMPTSFEELVTLRLVQRPVILVLSLDHRNVLSQIQDL